MSLLTVQGLSREPWFRDFQLEVAEDEIVVLRGPSGSGKTLLLRAIADLDPHDHGAVTLEGVDRSTLSAPAWRSRVLYVHPDGPRLPGTVADNVEAVNALAVRGGATGDATLEGLRADAEAERLSSGEAHTLALTRALACEPTVLLLDEPTASMDPQRARVWEERLVSWVADARAIVWITHEDGLAERLGARVVRFP